MAWRLVGLSNVCLPASETSHMAAASMTCYTLVPAPERFRVAVVSGRANGFSGVLPLPSTDCMLFDETCLRTSITTPMLKVSLPTLQRFSRLFQNKIKSSVVTTF